VNTCIQTPKVEYLFVDTRPHKGCQRLRFRRSGPCGLRIALPDTVLMLRILMGSPSEDPGTGGVPGRGDGTARTARDSSHIAIAPPQFSALRQPKSRRSAAFGSSMVCHAVVIAAAIYGSGPITYAPRRPLLQNYQVRYVQLQVPLPPPPSRAGGAGPSASPAPKAPAPKEAVKGSSAGSGIEAPAPQVAPQVAKAAPRKFELPRVAQAKPAEQTLIQLEVPPDVALKANIRVPTVVIWDPLTQHLPRPPTKKFIAPVRREVAKAKPSVMAEPTLELPNQERNIAELNLSAVRATDVPLLPHPPSATTPIRILNAAPATQVPQSAAAQSDQRDAANIISIPDFPMPAGKVLIIPPGYQVAAAHMAGGGDQGEGAESSSGKAGTGPAGGSGSQGQGFGGGASGTGVGASPSGQSTGGGTGGSGASGPGGNGVGHGALANGAGTGTGAGGHGGGTGVGIGPGGGSGSGGVGSGNGSARPVARIVRPKDGHFPAVVLGSGGSEQYPESVGVLGGRLVYTVYLRVGAKKAWIMQYCLPRSTEQTAKVKGAATPLEPPYPFLILRPELEFAPEMDYVIVHGIVNATGKLEQLAVVGMTGFAQEHLLLSSLGLWQFRPASRDGQPTSVEILLIIPREEV
jgi:hypothetical protein